MKDQYGQTVPKFLAVLDVMPDMLTKDELKELEQANWYKFEDATGTIFVDPRQVSFPLDQVHWQHELGFTGPIYRIAGPLKRYNNVDGFYHA